MEPLFGYDLVNGKLVENPIEADFVRFYMETFVGKKPTPPRHMIQSIIKYHNNKITAKEAQELAYDYKYIIMYHRALCKAKAKELLRQSEEEPVHKTRGRKKALAGPNELIETVLPTGGEEATNANVAPPVPVVSEPIISKEVYEAAQACLQEISACLEDAENRWHSTAEICEHLGICRNTLLDWIIKKGLPGYKVGRNWMFKPSEVDAWLNGPGPKELSYQKLFRIIQDRHWTKKQFAVMAGLSQATVTKMTVDGTAINTSVLDKICTTLGCKIGDIVQMVPADKTE